MSEKKKYHRGRRKPAAKLEDKRVKEKKKRAFVFAKYGKFIGAACMFLFVVLSVQMASAKGDSTAQIIMAVESQEILKDDALPQPSVVIECPKEQQDLLLDKNSGYQVKNLVEMLERGDGYQILCDADGKKEGKFDMKIELSDSLQKDLKDRYKEKIYLTTYDGVLNVKNKTGTWDGTKFKRYDGTYVKNEFVESKEKMYYFDEDGEMVTGWKEILSNRYHFTDKGIMEHDKWKKRKAGKSYLESDGKLAVGWSDIEDELYYFDEKGIMVTGKQKIGSSKCKFDEDGKLISKVSTLDPDKPMVALTFDDGPGERTMEILDALEKYDAHATFFMQGKNVSSHEKEIQKMYEIGCELGNHSYDHPQLTGCTDGGAVQVGTTNSLIKEACGHSATVLRPPYGAYNDTVSASVGMPIILWNVDTLDWQTKDAQATIDNVMNQTDDGDIVLMHDIHSSTVDAVLKLIPKLIAKDYQLVTVSELADARGIYLQNGVAYTDFNKTE